MIRFLVDTTSSLTDVNGNRYHFATITSTKTGKTLRVRDSGGDRNAPIYLRELTGVDWSEVHETHSDMAKRRFRHAAKIHENGAVFEHELTKESIAALETQ